MSISAPSAGRFRILPESLCSQQGRHYLSVPKYRPSGGKKRNPRQCSVPGTDGYRRGKNNMSDSFQELFLRHTPIRRMGTPEEIAAAVLYFGSEEAAYTTAGDRRVRRLRTGHAGIRRAVPAFGRGQALK